MSLKTTALPSEDCIIPLKKKLPRVSQQYHNIFRGFSQYLRTDLRIVLQVRPLWLLPLLVIRYSLVILILDVA